MTPNFRKSSGAVSRGSGSTSVAGVTRAPHLVIRAPQLADERSADEDFECAAAVEGRCPGGCPGFFVGPGLGTTEPAGASADAARNGDGAGPRHHHRRGDEGRWRRASGGGPRGGGAQHPPHFRFAPPPTTTEC